MITILTRRALSVALCTDPERRQRLFSELPPDTFRGTSLAYKLGRFFAVDYETARIEDIANVLQLDAVALADLAELAFDDGSFQSLDKHLVRLVSARQTEAQANDQDITPYAFAIKRITEVTGDASQAQSGRIIDLSQWHADQWTGEPVKRRYLISGRFPLGVAVMLASMGGIGKSFMMLLLALLVATGKDMSDCSVLGGNVEEFGTAVFFTAEDDIDQVHARLDALDPTGQRFRNPGKLIVIPLPNAGGPLNLVMQTRDGLKVTPEFKMIKAQLMKIPDLKLVVFDPLQNFVQANISADNDAGQFACAVFAQLGAVTGATIGLPHHMRKPSRPIITADDAREAIRGVTALVDGVRAAYALWPVEESEAKKICKSMSVTWEPYRIVRGAVVKANGKADKATSTFVRDDHGVLRDATSQLSSDGAGKGNKVDQLSVLEETIKAAAIGGQPYTKTGINGIFDRRSELPEILRIVPRKDLWHMVDDLLGKGRIVKSIHKGDAKKWLDVPGGPFALGSGMIRPGA